MQATTAQDADLSQFRGHLVELDAFQGPLDLLLHLIKRDRIEIWQISISRITRQYLDYLSTLQNLNIEVAGEFLVMAATLMRIKSQNLLPRPSFAPDEEGEEEPLSREGLIARLMEYRRFREAARAMGNLEWLQGRKHPRGAVASLDPGFSYPLKAPRLLDLAEYFRQMLTEKGPVTSHQVKLEDVKLEEQMEWVDSWLARTEAQELVPGGQQCGVRFDRLLRRPGLLLEVVVTFLAILELGRLQRLNVWQLEALGEIWILAREAPSVPVSAGVEEEMT